MTFAQMTPLNVYEYVAYLAHVYGRKGEHELWYMASMVDGRPSIAPYWLLPADTPQTYRVWLSPKRRCA